MTDIKFNIPASLEGERLDKSLALLLDLSRSQAAALLENKGVKLNRKAASSPSCRLKLGDRLEVAQDQLDNLLPELLAEPEVKVQLAHCDEHLLVVEKPAGMVVHPGAGNATGTMVAGLLAEFPELREVGDPLRPGIVHRLDKGTSGLMLVARSQQAYEALVADLAAKRVRREYLAVCAGQVANNQGMIDAPIGKSSRQPNLMQISATGKAAQTNYEVAERFAEATLLRCQLLTGRTHQIRVHLAAIDHPLVGDSAYNPDPLTLVPAELKSNFESRPALHSCLLVCQHPQTGQELSFTSELPADLEQLRAELAQSD